MMKIINDMSVACARFAKICLVVLFASSSLPALAMQPPSDKDRQTYIKDGSLQKRIANAKRIGNHKLSPKLLYNFAKRNKLQLRNMAPPPAWRGGLPSVGSPKVVVLLVDFNDYPASTQNSRDFVYNQMFGDGQSSNSPYESLTNYYQRASYGKLNIRGDVLEWYRARYNRSYYEQLGDDGNNTLIQEVVDYHDSLGHDFSQYDSDGDGRLDAVYIKWTGPDNGWSSFWWAYQWEANGVYVDGKEVGAFVWSWISNREQDGSNTYLPIIDIHETGHLLGLPDLYDYDPDVGPDGGVGGLDMMDGNWGDINPFFKTMLDWMSPQVINSGSTTRSLRPSGEVGDAVMIMPNATGDIFGEFFMAQYRKRGVGNDPRDYPTDGLLIWHVDATLDASSYDFLNDNSYSSRKLVALKQADGKQEIENNEAWADAGDYYTPPKQLSATSVPNSSRYNGIQTGVTINNLSIPQATMNAQFSVGISDTVAFDASKQEVYEDTQQVTLTLVRTNAEREASVNYSTKNGTAKSGKDFVAQNGTIRFSVGEIMQKIVVPIIHDQVSERLESFRVKLSGPSNGTYLGTTKTITVQIKDARPTNMSSANTGSNIILRDTTDRTHP